MSAGPKTGVGNLWWLLKDLKCGTLTNYLYTSLAYVSSSKKCLQAIKLALYLFSIQVVPNGNVSVNIFYTEIWNTL
jgi:hypothetical protein